MRLPWPFGRSTEPPEGPAAADRPDSPPPAAHGAWASLPPIQRSIGAAPLVAPTEPFLADMPGVRPLPPIVETLGHDVTPMAPVGLVSAPVHPTPALTSHAALIPPPVQRRAEGTGPGWSSSTTSEPPAPSVAPAVPPEGPSRTLGVVPPEATVRPPARSLTRAEATAPIGPAVAAQAQAGAPGQRPIMSRRTQVSASAAASTAPTVSRTTETPALAQGPGPSRRAGLGAPLPATPPTAVRPEVVSAFPAQVLAQLAAATAGGGATGAEATGGASGAQASSAQATGSQAGAGALDLAPPMRSARPTAGNAPLQTTRMQRRTTAPVAPAAAIPADQRKVDAPGESTLSLARPSAPAPSRLPVLPVVGDRQHDDGARGAASTGAGDPIQRQAPRPTGLAVDASRSEATAGRPTDQPSASRPELPVRRPLLGSRPIQTSVQTQRSHEPVAEGLEAGDDRASAGPSSRPLAAVPAIAAPGDVAELTSSPGGRPVLPAGGPSWEPVRLGPTPAAIQRQGAGGDGNTWPARPSAASFGASGVGLQGWAGPILRTTFGAEAPTTTLVRASVPALAPAAYAAAAIQRQAPGSVDSWPARWPVASSDPAGAGARTQDWAAPTPGPATPAMSLVRPPAPPAAPAPSAPAAVPPTISRSIVAASPAPPAVQASIQEAATATPVLGPTATPVIQRIDGSAPTPPEPAGEHSDKELDELARAIFGRLRGHLRSEYIHEREAKGLTFDNS